MTNEIKIINSAAISENKDKLDDFKEKKGDFNNKKNFEQILHQLKLLMHKGKLIAESGNPAFIKVDDINSLEELMNLSKSFVGKVEALGQPDKYSIRHLALIAKALKLKSLYELLPKSIPDEDIIEIVYTKVPKINKDGSESKQLEERIIEIWSI